MVAALVHAFPEAMRDKQDWARVAYLSGFLVLVTAGVLRARRVRPAHLRYLAIWMAGIAVLVLGFAYCRGG
jgi:hypothetical protein